MQNKRTMDPSPQEKGQKQNWHRKPRERQHRGKRKGWYSLLPTQQSVSLYSPFLHHSCRLNRVQCTGLTLIGRLFKNQILRDNLQYTSQTCQLAATQQLIAPLSNLVRSQRRTFRSQFSHAGNSLTPEFWLKSGYQIIHEMPKLYLYIGFEQLSQVYHTDSHNLQHHLDTKAKDSNFSHREEQAF